MKETTGQEQPKRRGRRASDAPELRVVGIDFKPAPDAEERLRRLFTILARLVEGDLATPEAESLQGEGEGKDEDEDGEGEA